MKAVIRYLIMTILLILFFLGGMILFVFSTEKGTRLAFEITGVFLPGELNVSGVHGRLLDSLTIDHLKYQSLDMILEIEDLQLKWRALSLIDKNIWIKNINIKNLYLQIKEKKSAEKKAFISEKQENKFLFPLEINQLNLQKIQIQYMDKKPVTIENLEGSLILKNHVFLDLKTSVLSPINMKAQLFAEGKLKDYEWRLLLKNHKTDWLGYGKGNENGLSIATAKNKISNGQLSITGQLNWLPKLNWDISLQAKSLDLKSLYENSPFAGSIDLSGTAKNSELNAKLSLKQLKLINQDDILMQGEFSMHTLFLPEKNKVNISTEIALKEGQINYKTEEKTLIFPLNGILKLKNNHAGLASQLDLQLNRKKFIQADLSLSNNQLLHGKIQAQFDQSQMGGLNLSLFKNPQANFVANFQINGSLEKPHIEGYATLKSKELSLIKSGIQLQNLSLQANAKNDTIEYKGSVFSGNGILRLQGKTQVNKSGFNSLLSISGNQFLASNTSKVKLFLSPDLKIENKIDGWHVDGKVVIPRANIKLSDKMSTVALPPETIIVQTSGKIKQDKSLPIFAQIKLSLGDDVRLETSGLNTLVNGELLIRDYPNAEIFATGRLNLTKGTYDLKGQELAVNNSAFIFSNSAISNPNLSIRATKEIRYTPSKRTQIGEQNLTVGMQITGTAENPNIVLFSDPAGWSQPDILSLILLGQPASTASGANLQLLTTAAKALTPQAGGGLGQLNNQLQKFFGLSEFGLQSSISDPSNINSINDQPSQEKNSTSFVFGKYLSPRLYLNYSLNVLNSVNTLRLRYLLGKNWFIQTQANTLGSGVDVLYSVER